MKSPHWQFTETYSSVAAAFGPDSPSHVDAGLSDSVANEVYLFSDDIVYVYNYANHSTDDILVFTYVHQFWVTKNSSLNRWPAAAGSSLPHAPSGITATAYMNGQVYAFVKQRLYLYTIDTGNWQYIGFRQ